MKKLIALVLVLLFVNLCACGEENQTSETKVPDNVVENSEVQIPADPNAGKVAVWIVNGIINNEDVDDTAKGTPEYDENYNLQKLSLEWNENGEKYTGVSYYVFDTAGHLVVEGYADDGDNIEYRVCAYDLYGNRIEDGGDGAEYVYDDKGNITMEIYKYRTINYTYNAQGKLLKTVEVSDDRGTVTNTYEYDQSGNLIKVMDSNGDVITYEYDQNGKCIKVDRPHDINDVTFEYDDQGRQIVSDSEIYYVATHYDENGNVSKFTGRDGGLYCEFTYQQVYVTEAQAELIKLQQEELVDFQILF